MEAMTLKKFQEKKRSEFQRAYEKTYQGILPDEVLRKGNPWFESFLDRYALDLLKEVREIIKKQTEWQWEESPYFNREIMRHCKICGYLENDPESLHECEVKNEEHHQLLTALDNFINELPTPQQICSPNYAKNGLEGMY